MDFDAFDTALGPASDRYFGHGYRLVSQWCDDIAVTHPAPDRVRVTATARIDRWHRTGLKRADHLGTVDAIAIAATVASIAIIAAGHAPAGQECELVAVSVRAGAAAETSAAGIPVAAEWNEADATGSGIEEVPVRIGRLTVAVRLRTSRLPLPLPLPLARSVDADRTLGPRADRYFADGHKATRIHATTLDLAERAAACTFTTDPPTVRLGVIECLVLTSQLAQAALYAAAGVTREQTGNLWMRHCSFQATAETPTPPTRAALDVTKLTVLNRREPRIVSSEVRITAFPGWRGTAALAFELRAP